jgi:hypothetical protein
MDVFLKKIIETTWGKSLLYSILGGLSAAVVWLAIENRRLNEARSLEQKDARREVVETERRCASNIELLNRQHLDFVKAALERMQGLEDRQKRKR